MKFTILGSKGFIGSHLIEFLKTKDCEILTPKISEITDENLGHVIYCIGVTSDFRDRPFDTVESHVSIVNNLIKTTNFESFLYLSSTRVYMNSSTTKEENPIEVQPDRFTEIYNISKIMGESICLSSKKDNVRIARLSNVIGANFDSDNFLFSLIKEAIQKNKILLNTDLKSEKDYITIQDVVEILYKITLEGKQKIYNVASGENILVKEITDLLKKEIGCEIEITDNPTLNKFKIINIDKLKNEFNFKPKDIRNSIQDLVIKYRDRYSKL